MLNKDIVSDFSPKQKAMSRYVPFLLFVFSMIMQKSFAQDSLIMNDLMRYKIRILTIEHKSIYGKLTALDSLGLKIDDKKSVKFYSYLQIQETRVKRKGTVGKGIFFGILGGAVIGVISGLTEPTTDVVDYILDISRGEKVAYSALGGGILGGIVGGITGAIIHRSFIIKGRKEKFSEMRNKLLSRVYKRIY